VCIYKVWGDFFLLIFMPEGLTLVALGWAVTMPTGAEKKARATARDAEGRYFMVVRVLLLLASGGGGVGIFFCFFLAVVLGGKSKCLYIYEGWLFVVCVHSRDSCVVCGGVKE
jgi:hypothetical protein